MKSKHYLFFLSILGMLMFSTIANASPQGGKTPDSVKDNRPAVVKGVVKDEFGEPLPGVSVTFKGTTLGVLTDGNGAYTLSIPPGSPKSVLRFTFIGMAIQEIPITSNEMNVVMKEDAMLEEVVVTGIFSKKRESYTGAATTITSTELKEAGNRSLISSIQNLDPSFSIADNFNIGSDPNATASITMRGSSSLPVGVKDMQVDNTSLRKANQPLFILNGFEITLERFQDLDENQVEDITLLKDASSTAMYGSKGANGVVVITTRRPKKGRLQLTYKGSLMLEAPDLSSYNLMNAREKLAFEKSAGLYTDENNIISQQGLLELYNSRMLDMERGVDTYWLKYPVRTGVGSKHGVTVEGGDDALLYNMNLAYKNIEGAMKGSSRNTVEGSMFLSYNLNKVLKFQNELRVSSTKAKQSPYSFSKFAGVNSYFKPYDDDGNLLRVLENRTYSSMTEGAAISGQSKIYNPLYDALLPSLNENEYTNIQNNFAMEWYILPELFFRGQIGVTIEKSRSDRYLSVNHTSFDKLSSTELDRKGTYEYGSGEVFAYEFKPTLNYTKIFDDIHQIYAGIGLTVEEEKGENYRFKAEGISVPNIDFIGMANQYEKDGKPFASEYIRRSVGFIFNGNYTYDRRYFVDVNGKYDGSSQFGSENKFAPFWSTGIGWNLSNEKFMRDYKFISLAKLRLSYGIIGSQAFDSYLAMQSYRDTGTKGYSGWYGVYMQSMGNPDLQWQKTKQLNFGVDLSLFDGRFRMNLDIYDKTTDNLLADITLPSSSGFTTYNANVGTIDNGGVEIGTNVVLIRDKKTGFTWSVGATMAHNKNIVKKISNSLEFLSDFDDDGSSSNVENLGGQSVNPSLMFKEGENINTIYAVRSKGIDPSSGKEIFIKLDGTETFIWDARDKVACGVLDAKYKGGLNTTVRYKGITLSTFFNYRWGGQMYNQTLADRIENIMPINNADKRAYYDRWREPGDIAKFKSVKDRSVTYATDRFVMDLNTLTCSNITLAYDLPSSWSKKYLHTNFVSVSGNVENAFYISTVKQQRGLDYPFARQISFSLTARF